MGLHRAGFDVTGVDIKRQPRYPFAFVQADALNPPFRLEDFDLVWASPPCQAYSQCTPKKYRSKHRALIGPVREMLLHSGRPFVIENVPSARRKLKSPAKLCGSMFGLMVRRHRFFETEGFFVPSTNCHHADRPVLITGTHRRKDEPRYEYGAEECRQASGLHWMRRVDMDQAIPPAYAEHIGRYAIMALEAQKVSA